MKPSERLLAVEHDETIRWSAHGATAVPESAIHSKKIDEIARILDEMQSRGAVKTLRTTVIESLDAMTERERSTTLLIIADRYDRMGARR